MTKLNDPTSRVDPRKLMAELNQRPELWVNILQSMAQTTDDELKDDPNGHASFETLLAHALGEHTGMFTDDGDETEWLDVYYDGAQGDEVPTAS
jgi:hypothetical protein